MSTNNAVCTSCTKPKSELKARRSKVLHGVPMFLCQSCIDAKMEPRGFLVLAGRDAFAKGENGLKVIEFWIKPQRYHGGAITLRELT